MKDVEVEGEKESEGEENDEEMEANVLEEDEPEPSQEIPPVQSYHLSDSSSDSSGDSDREDPLLGGMISNLGDQYNSPEYNFLNAFVVMFRNCPSRTLNETLVPVTSPVSTK